MEKSKPLELGLDLLKNYGIVENNECRFISHEIGGTQLCQHAKQNT